MILYIIKWTLIYSVLILLLHNLYLFFQNNLTTTKIKDYYNTFAIENAKINMAEDILLHKPVTQWVKEIDRLEKNLYNIK